MKIVTLISITGFIDFYWAKSLADARSCRYKKWGLKWSGSDWFETVGNQLKKHVCLILNMASMSSAAHETAMDLPRILLFLSDTFILYPLYSNYYVRPLKHPAVLYILEFKITYFNKSWHKSHVWIRKKDYILALELMFYNL